jgi:hypothetical protein
MRLPANEQNVNFDSTIGEYHKASLGLGNHLYSTLNPTASPKSYDTASV